MKFGRPNAETGRKMANGRLLFLALVCLCVHIMYMCIIMLIIHAVCVVFPRYVTFCVYRSTLTCDNYETL